MENVEKKETFWQAFLNLFKNKNFILMMLISALNTGGQVFVKTPTNLFGKGLGMTPPVLGAITGTYYLICLIFRPTTGPLIDKFNKKAVLTFCLLIRVASYALFAVSTSPTMFTAARYIDAVSFCLCTTCFLAVATTLIDKKAMGTGIAVYSAFPSLVTMMMPSLSMAIYNKSGAKPVFFGGVAFIVAAIVLIQFLDFSKTVVGARNVLQKKFRFSDVFYAPVVPVCLLTFFLSLLLTVNDTYLLIVASERGIIGAELFFSIQSAIKFVASFAGGIGSDTVGVKKILVISCIFSIIATILIGVTTTLPLIIVAAVLYCLGQKGSAPVITKACALLAPPEKRGAAISTNYFIMDLAGVFAGYLAAACYAAFGYTGMYMVIALFPTAGLIILLLTYKSTFGKMEEKEAEIAASRATKQ